MHVFLTMLELKLIPFQRHPDTCDATVSFCEAGLIGTTELIIKTYSCTVAFIHQVKI